MKHKTRLAIFFGIYGIPPFLLLMGWVDYSYRYYLMAPVILFSLAHALANGFSTSDLGMRRDNFRIAALWQIPIPAICAIIAVYLVNKGYVRNLDAPQNPWFYLMYLTISGPVQEFVYRAVPFAELDKQSFHPYLKIGMVAFNFAWLHVLYQDALIFLAALCIGLYWTIAYHRHRNLWAVAVSHAICGFLAIWYGLI